MIMHGISAIARDRATLLRDVTLISSEVIESVYDETLLSTESELMTEAAKFSLFPRFKKFEDKYPEFKEYESLVKEAEAIAGAAGETINDDMGIKIQKFLNKLFGVLTSVTSVILIPFCIFIYPIIYYLLNRFCVWAYDTERFDIAEKELKRGIATMQEVKQKTKDAKTKKRCDEMIAKMEKKMRRMRSAIVAKESGDDVAEDDVDLMAEFEDEITDIDVEDFIDKLDGVDDTTDEEIDRLLEDEDDDVSADSILLPPESVDEEDLL